MECKIKYVAENELGEKDYWCTTHKTLASIHGEEQKECLYKEKEAFEKEKMWNKEEIKTLEFIFKCPYASETSKILVNGEEITALFIEDARIIKDDFYGLFTSLKNNVPIEEVHCTICGGLHNDNGVFAIKPHSNHLCFYCGNFFQLEEKNVGQELKAFFEIPNLKEIPMQKEGNIYKYNILTGEVKIIN